MSTRKRIQVPETMADVTVGTYIKLAKANDPPKEGMDAVRLGIEILCGLPKPMVQRIAFADVAKIARIMVKLMEPPKTEEFPLVPRFFLGNVEYGFIPDWSELSLGEFVDLEEYCKGDVWESLPDVLSVMYRPVVSSMGPLYEIQPYKPSPGQRDKMLECPMNVALGAMVFFYDTGRVFGRVTESSLQASSPRWGRSGVGIKLFTGWLRATFFGLRR
jgi:hypothetical protein